jgi:hypothetical protein
MMTLYRCTVRCSILHFTLAMACMYLAARVYYCTRLGKALQDQPSYLLLFGL